VPWGEFLRKLPRSSGRWRDVLRWAGLVLAAFVVSSFLAVLALRWINPVVTPLMMIRLADGMVHLRWVGIDDRPVPLEAVSPAVLRAVIAAEDAHFFTHWGVDVDALRKAKAWNERHAAQGRVRGASTITMQCARNVFLWQGRTYVRKALEIWFSGLMELLWSKRRILEVYLNVIEWGPGIYGVQAASEHYFDVPASRLDARQAALLAAVLPNPLERNPAEPSASVDRRAAMIARRAARVRLGPLRARDPGARRTVSAPRARATARRETGSARLPVISRRTKQPSSAATADE
jgi:monofunctional glycosyltransferase